MIGQFWQFPSTFTSITCLRTRKAKQTRRTCETLLHHIFCHLDTRNSFSGSRRTEVIKKMLTGSPPLSSQPLSLAIFFPCSPSFFGRSALTESLSNKEQINPWDPPLEFLRKFVKINWLFSLPSNPLSFHLNTYNLMTRIQGAEVSHVFSCLRQELFLGRWHLKRNWTVFQMFPLFATSFLWRRAGKRPPGMDREQQQTDESDSYCSLLQVHCNTESAMF